MVETKNYLFEEKEQDNGNYGVIHVYRKNDNAWVGFIRYIKKTENGKPFVKFFSSDLNVGLTEEFKQELKEFSNNLSKKWLENGEISFGFSNQSDIDVKLKMTIDKGDGKPPKKIVV